MHGSCVVTAVASHLRFLVAETDELLNDGRVRVDAAGGEGVFHPLARVGHLVVCACVRGENGKSVKGERS